MTSNVTVKPLLKLRLPRLALFSLNLENWKTSAEKTKNVISIKLTYIDRSSYSLFYEVRLALNFFFWIFLIDVIKLEYGKVLLLSSFPMCSWIVHLCNSPSTLVSLQNFLLAFPHNLLQVSSPLQLDLLLLVTCKNISIRQVMLMKLHILLNLLVKSKFYLKGLDFTLLQHTTWIYSVF